MENKNCVTQNKWRKVIFNKKKQKKERKTKTKKTILIKRKLKKNKGNYGNLTK